MPRKKAKERKCAKTGQPRPTATNGEATKHRDASNIGTPYDDVFKTMALYVARLLLPVLNELFGTRYTGEERVEHRNSV